MSANVSITALSAVAFTCYSLLHSSLFVVLWHLYSREVPTTSFCLILMSTVVSSAVGTRMSFYAIEIPFLVSITLTRY